MLSLLLSSCPHSLRQRIGMVLVRITCYLRETHAVDLCIPAEMLSLYPWPYFRPYMPSPISSWNLKVGCESKMISSTINFTHSFPIQHRKSDQDLLWYNIVWPLLTSCAWNKNCQRKICGLNLMTLILFVWENQEIIHVEHKFQLCSIKFRL